MIAIMYAHIDRFGRIVIPKSIRERLGLTPGVAVNIDEVEGCVQIAPVVEGGALKKSEFGHLVLTGKLTEEVSDPLEWARNRRNRDIAGLDN